MHSQNELWGSLRAGKVTSDNKNNVDIKVDPASYKPNWVAHTNFEFFEWPCDEKKTKYVATIRFSRSICHNNIYAMLILLLLWQIRFMCMVSNINR